MLLARIYQPIGEGPFPVLLEPGPETDRAYEIVKAFIARQLQALQQLV